MTEIDDRQLIWGGALAGAGYGAMAMMMNTAADITLLSMTLTVGSGAALFACVTSGLCRCYHAWHIMIVISDDLFRDL